LIAVPGLVDMHVHFREPGQTYKEDIATGGQAAARGGFTTVCCMANTLPAIDSRELVELVASKAAAIELLVVGALSKGLNGKELADFAGMKQGGICALSDDGKTLMDRDLMKQAALQAKELGLFITDHCEPETEIVARDIELARETGCHFHLQHISLKESLELIKTAKAEGINITCETAPHYFTLTSEALKSQGANAKMNPPLKSEADRLAVIEAIQDGTIDVIATDHAPHSQEEKAQGVESAPFGVIGLETAFALSYTKLVMPGLISLQKLIELMSINPAKILNLHRDEGDFAIFDIGTAYKINSKEFASKSRNTPFEGMEVYGRTVMTVSKGRLIYNDRSFN